MFAPCKRNSEAGWKKFHHFQAPSNVTTFAQHPKNVFSSKRAFDARAAVEVTSRERRGDVNYATALMGIRKGDRKRI